MNMSYGRSPHHHRCLSRAGAIVFLLAAAAALLGRPAQGQGVSSSSSPPPANTTTTLAPEMGDGRGPFSAPPYEPSTLARAANGAVRFVGLTTLVSFAVSQAAPIAPLLDAQALGILSQSPCVDAETQYVLSGAMDVALPLARFFDSFVMAALIQLAILIVIAGFPYVRALFDAPPQSGSSSSTNVTSDGKAAASGDNGNRKTDQDDEDRPWRTVPLFLRRDVLQAARWPQLPLAVGTYALAALVFGSADMLMSSERTSQGTLLALIYAAAALGFIVGYAICQRAAHHAPDVVCRPFAFIRLWATVSDMTYDISKRELKFIPPHGATPEIQPGSSGPVASTMRSPPRGTDAGCVDLFHSTQWESQPHTVFWERFEKAFRTRPQWLWDPLLPRGTWWPPTHEQSFGCVVSWITPSFRVPFVGVANLLRVIIACAGAAYPSRTADACGLQHGAIALVHMLAALAWYLTLDRARVPLRRPWITASALTTSVATAAVGHPLMFHLIPPALFAACAAWLFTACVDIVYAVAEFYWCAPMENGLRIAHSALLRDRMSRRPPPRRKGDDEATNSHDSDDAFTDDNMAFDDDDGGRGSSSDSAGRWDGVPRRGARRGVDDRSRSHSRSSSTLGASVVDIESRFSASEDTDALNRREPLDEHAFDLLETERFRQRRQQQRRQQQRSGRSASLSQLPPVCRTYVAPPPPTHAQQLVQEVVEYVDSSKKTRKEHKPSSRATTTRGPNGSTAGGGSSSLLRQRHHAPRVIVKPQPRAHGRFTDVGNDWEDL